MARYPDYYANRFWCLLMGNQALSPRTIAYCTHTNKVNVILRALNSVNQQTVLIHVLQKICLPTFVFYLRTVIEHPPNSVLGR